MENLSDDKECEQKHSFHPYLMLSFLSGEDQISKNSYSPQITRICTDKYHRLSTD